MKSVDASTTYRSAFWRAARKRFSRSIAGCAQAILVAASGPIRIDEPAPTPHADAPRIIDLRGAVRAVQLVPGLFALLVFSTFNNFLGGSFMALLDPYGLTLVSVEEWGIVLAVTSLGFVAGGILVASNVVPERLRELYDAVLAGDTDAAEATDRSLRDLYAVMSVAPPAVSAKTALELLGVIGATARLPMAPASPDERERIRAALEGHGLLGAAAARDSVAS